jgi:hypothetical protein
MSRLSIFIVPCAGRDRDSSFTFYLGGGVLDGRQGGSYWHNRRL